MYNSIRTGILVATVGAILAVLPACKESEQDVKVQVNLSISGGSGSGTGGSSRDTTLTVSGKMEGGIVKVDVPVTLPYNKKVYQLDITPAYDYKTTRMQRYVKMSSDTGGSSPDTLYYKTSRDDKDDDRK